MTRERSSRRAHAYVTSTRSHGFRQPLPAAGLQALEPQVCGGVHAQKGHIPFADGRVCDLEATDDTLTMRAQAPDAEALERLQRVVVGHVKRFAFREDLGEVSWTPTN